MQIYDNNSCPNTIQVLFSSPFHQNPSPFPFHSNTTVINSPASPKGTAGAGMGQERPGSPGNDPGGAGGCALSEL